MSNSMEVKIFHHDSTEPITSVHCLRFEFMTPVAVRWVVSSTPLNYAEQNKCGGLLNTKKTLIVLRN